MSVGEVIEKRQASDAQRNSTEPAGAALVGARVTITNLSNISDKKNLTKL